MSTTILDHVPGYKSIERAALLAVRDRADYSRYVCEHFAWARAEGKSPAEAESLAVYTEVLK